MVPLSWPMGKPSVSLSEQRIDRRNSTFINKILNFLGVGLALYIVALIYEWASSDSIIKTTVKCKYCRKRISEKVTPPQGTPSDHAKIHIGETLCELYELAWWERRSQLRIGWTQTQWNAYIMRGKMCQIAWTRRANKLITCWCSQLFIATSTWAHITLYSMLDPS